MVRFVMNLIIYVGRGREMDDDTYSMPDALEKNTTDNIYIYMDLLTNY